jgi:hypothetical protein
MLSDPAGVENSGRIFMTPDAKTCVFGYHRMLADRYLVEGLKETGLREFLEARKRRPAGRPNFFLFDPWESVSIRGKRLKCPGSSHPAHSLR